MDEATRSDLEAFEMLWEAREILRRMPRKERLELCRAAILHADQAVPGHPEFNQLAVDFMAGIMEAD